MNSEAVLIVEKFIIKILKRRNIRLVRTEGGPFTFFDLSISRNSRRCKYCEGHDTKLLAEIAHPYSSIIVKFTSPIEFDLTYRMAISKGNVYHGFKFSEWDHRTTIDLSDPSSFTKLQEFITRHLPRGKST